MHKVSAKLNPSKILLPYVFSKSLLYTVNVLWWHSNQTSLTLQLKNIHSPSLRTSHTPCLCSVQSHWYNYSFILTLLDLYPQYSIGGFLPIFYLSPILPILYPQSSISPILYPQTLFSASHALYPSFILCTPSLSHPPTAATCDPRDLKQSTSSIGEPFSSLNKKNVH